MAALPAFNPEIIDDPGPAPRRRHVILVLLAGILLLLPLLGWTVNRLTQPPTVCGCSGPPRVVILQVQQNRESGLLTVRWREESLSVGAQGFDVYAGHHRLTVHRVAEHRENSEYVYQTTWRGDGSITVHQMFVDGTQMVYRQDSSTSV